MVKLWTFQNQFAVAELLKTSILETTLRHVRDGWNVFEDNNYDMWADIEPSYKFMNWRLAKHNRDYMQRLRTARYFSKYHDVRDLWPYPVWAYVKKPDLRSHYSDKKHKEFLLTVDIDPSRFIISDIDSWCNCLNRWHIPWTEEEDDLIYNQVEHLTDKERLPIVRKTWGRTFEVEKMTEESGYLYGNPTLQACIDRISLDDVTEIKLVN